MTKIPKGFGTGVKAAQKLEDDAEDAIWNFVQQVEMAALLGKRVTEAKRTKQFYDVLNRYNLAVVNLAYERLKAGPTPKAKGKKRQ